MKKVSILLICLMLILPIGVKALESNKEDKSDTVEESEVVNQDQMVKVYVFHAPDCSVCIQEFQYLEGLESYNKKFTIEKKELFASIHEGTLGSDYNLGVKVAAVFNKAGFRSVSTNATPLIIISDVYAENAYNDQLESIINQVYEEGDKDVVGCIAAGKENCIEEKKFKLSSKAIIILSVSLVAVVAIIVSLGLVMSKKEEN